MKKILLSFFAVIFALIPVGCNKTDKEVLRINEVTHSVFYAPLYIAIEKGFFNEEGIKVELTNGGGADASMTAVISKSADIGLMGPETVIYVQNQGKKDKPKVFAQLTQKDGSFLVSRKAEPTFNWEDLKGKEILAGRRGGVPAMTFEYILKEKSLEINKDFTLNFDVQFNLMTSAFLEGTADYCTVFEPTASEYEKQGLWHIVASVGEEGGEIPYTSFIALDSFLENNEKKVEKFIKALNKAIDFLINETENTVAKSIIKQFPNTTVESIETSIKSYKKINAWKLDLVPTEESFSRLQDIMINAGELKIKSSFKDLVNLRKILSLAK